MCNMLVSPKGETKEINFIVYNIVFSETSGKFTLDKVYNQLRSHQVDIEKDKLEQLFERWVECGILFDNAKEYVVNSAIIL